MMVAGLGWRAAATAESLASALEAALARAGMPVALTALATAADKAADPALLQFAAQRGLPVLAISVDLLQTQVAGASAHVPARYGQHSLAEAAALAAAGAGARLLGPRSVSQDRLATAAIAIPTFTPENTSP